jgi:hypothetical protein
MAAACCNSRRSIDDSAAFRGFLGHFPDVVPLFAGCLRPWKKDPVIYQGLYSDNIHIVHDKQDLTPSTGVYYFVITRVSRGVYAYNQYCIILPFVCTVFKMSRDGWSIKTNVLKIVLL